MQQAVEVFNRQASTEEEEEESVWKEALEYRDLLHQDFTHYKARKAKLSSCTFLLSHSAILWLPIFLHRGVRERRRRSYVLHVLSAMYWVVLCLLFRLCGWVATPVSDQHLYCRILSTVPLITCNRIIEGFVYRIRIIFLLYRIKARSTIFGSLFYRKVLIASGKGLL